MQTDQKKETIFASECRLLRKGSFSALAWDERRNLLAAMDEDNKQVVILNPEDKEPPRQILPYQASCLTYDVYGRLLICERERGEVVRMDHYGPACFGQTWNQTPVIPQKLVIHSSGTYFLLGKERIYFVIPEGRTLFPASEQGFAHGTALCLPPEESGLLMIEENSRRLLHLEFDLEGHIGTTRTLVFGKSLWNEPPVAIKTDKLGRIYCLSSQGLDIFSSQGRQIVRVLLPYIPKGGCFGGKNNETFFITSPQGIWILPVKVPGHREGTYLPQMGVRI